MTMIDMARYGLQDRLRENDRVREEENLQVSEMRIQFHLITILIQNQAVNHPNQHNYILDHGHPTKKI